MSEFISPGLRSIASDARARAEREARDAAAGARGAASDAQGAVNDTLASAKAEANRIAASLSPAGLLQLLPRGVDYLEIRSRFSPPMFVKVSELVRQYPAPAPAATADASAGTSQCQSRQPPSASGQLRQKMGGG
jgi:regulator of protease activity HflC (stomatin/prohibitin superfamily)